MFNHPLHPNKPKVTSERKLLDLESGSGIYICYLLPQRYILLADDLGRERILASPLPGLWLPVVSAYTRAKDGVTTVRCPTRSLSQIRQHNHPAPAGFFLRFPPCFPAHLHYFAAASNAARTGASRIANARKQPKRSNFIEFYKNPVPIKSRRDG
jgi:hypothetical protein